MISKIKENPTDFGTVTLTTELFFWPCYYDYILIHITVICNNHEWIEY